MKIFLVITLFLRFNNLLAQSNDLQVISTSGSSLTSENHIVEYTLGEFAIDNIGNGIILTQGFHQGKLAIQTQIKEIDFKINLFPNPAHTHFKVEFNSPKTVDIIFTDISNLAQGIYTFTIIDSTNKQATYKIKKLR